MESISSFVTDWVLQVLSIGGVVDDKVFESDTDFETIFKKYYEKGY